MTADTHPKREKVAFVAGATGYTGQALVPALVKHGVRVVAHVRPDSPSLSTWRERFERAGASMQSTAWEPAAMTATLSELKPSHIFALLGTTRRRAKLEGMSAREAYERIDYGLTALLINAAVASGGNARFVYVSAAGTSPGATSAYGQARARAEQTLRESGLAFTIVRPSFITGSDRAERRSMERLGATVADGLLTVAGAFGARGLRERYQSMTAPELAEALVAVALAPDAEGKVLDGEELRRAGRRGR